MRARLPSRFRNWIAALAVLAWSPLPAAHADLSWRAPEFNTDGTPLTDLAGYTIYAGCFESGSYELQPATIDSPTVTTYRYEGLPNGAQCYFAATAYDAGGVESAFSGEVTKTTAALDEPIPGPVENLRVEWSESVVAFPGTPTVTEFTGGGVNPSFDYPATSLNDLLLIFVQTDENNGTLGTPGSLVKLDQVAGSASTAAAYYLIADGTETGSETITRTFDGNDSYVIQVHHFTSWHGSQAPEISASSSAFNSAANAASVTASWGSDDNRFINFVGYADDAVAVSSLPTNYTNTQFTQHNGTANQTSSISTSYRELDGATDDPGETTLAGNQVWRAWTIVVRGSAGGGSTVQADIVSPFESPAGVSVGRSSALEALGGIQSARSATIEALTGVLQGRTAGFESIAGIQSTRTATIESLTSLFQDRTAGIEALSSISQARQAVIEALAGVQAGHATPFEALGSALVSFEAVTPIEALGFVSASEVSPIEALQGIEAGRAAVIEALTQLSAERDTGFEATGHVAAESILTIEAKATVAASHVPVFEALAGLSAGVTLTHEALGYIAGATGIPFEALQNPGVVSVTNVVERDVFFTVTLRRDATFTRTLARDSLFAQTVKRDVEF